MSRVKISKDELADNDLPPICMICGKKPATTQIPHTARYVGFPANIFGLLGKYLLALKKWPMKVLACDGCKNGFKNERVFSDLWKTIHTVALIGVFYYLFTDPKGIPQNLVIPGGMLAAVALLETIHFWSIGKRNAIRVIGIERHFVSFDFPNGHWGVAYTTHKREHDAERMKRRPTPNLAPPPSAGADTMSAAAAPLPHEMPAQAAPPPPGAPQIGDPTERPSLDDMFGPTPPPGAPVVSANPAAGGPVITHTSDELNFVAFEGSELAYIPEQLSDLFKVIKEGDTDLLEVALKKGADINETLPNGMNGLHLAALAGVMQVADFLIRCGLSPNSEMANGLTPLHLAVQSNSQNLVGILLAKKGNPNHQNTQGRTPLHWCAAVKDDRLEPKHRLQIAQMLRRGGGDVAIRDQNGKTPTDLARESGDTMLTDALS